MELPARCAAGVATGRGRGTRSGLTPTVRCGRSGLGLVELGLLVTVYGDLTVRNNNVLLELALPAFTGALTAGGACPFPAGPTSSLLVIHFVWTSLRAAETDSSAAMGRPVLNADHRTERRDHFGLAACGGVDGVLDHARRDERTAG